jgi:hypothetical protein
MREREKNQENAMPNSERRRKIKRSVETEGGKIKQSMNNKQKKEKWRRLRENLRGCKEVMNTKKKVCK